MASLAITAPRAELLRAIDAEQVTEDWFTNEPGEIRHREYPGRTTRVTGKVRVMKAAGLCETDPADDDFDVRGIRLTDAGRQALADYDAPKVRLDCGHIAVKQRDVASWCPKCKAHRYTANDAEVTQ